MLDLVWKKQKSQNVPAAFMPALSPPLVRTAMRRFVLREGLGTVKRISVSGEERGGEET